MSNKMTYRDIPPLLVGFLPWLVIVAFAAAALTKLLGASWLVKSSPSPLSIILIVVATSVMPSFLPWARSRTPKFWIVTLAAWAAAGILIWGSLAGWINLAP
jgi:hypothetical protein